MPIRREGSTKVKTEQPEWKLEATADAVSLTQYFQEPFDEKKLRDLLKQLQSSSELIPQAKLTSIRANRLPGLHLRYELEYTASADEVSIIPPREDPYAYQLSTDIRVEPIQAHPKFYTAAMAGGPTDPKNEAVFEKMVHPDTGAVIMLPASESPYPWMGQPHPAWRFKGWGPGSKFEGVTTFEARSPRWTEVRKSNRPPDLTRIGRIDQPDGPVPGWSGPWLHSNVGYTLQGGVYTSTREWEGLQPPSSPEKQDALNIIYG